MKVKICGITRQKDAGICDILGVEYIGLNFWQHSKRYIDIEKAKSITASLKRSKPIGIFVEKDLEYIKTIIGQCSLSGIQIYAGESSVFCNEVKKQFPRYMIIQAFRIKDCLPGNLSDFNADYFLFDALSDSYMGGTGTTFNWDTLKLLKPYSYKTFIAGGINAENIEQLLSIINPFAVDIASGVEISPGIKDVEKIKLLLSKIKRISNEKSS
ncbi:MAG TPA: phosphoribosylanthranilate isomerase [bacterium]|nr:phosphoribosylanthranilate isomerase [bacterium]